MLSGSVEQFKNEMRNYNYYVSMLDSLEEKLENTYYELSGVKGVRYDKIPSAYNKELIEQKRFDLMQKIDKLENEISRLSGEIEHIDSILECIENAHIKKAIIDVYVNGCAIADICKDYCLTPAGLLYQMNKSIKETIDTLY